MNNRIHQIAGVIGSVLVALGFLLGVPFHVGAGWIFLLVGTVLLAYAIYCGSQPFLREWTE